VQEGVHKLASLDQTLVEPLQKGFEDLGGLRLDTVVDGHEELNLLQQLPALFLSVLDISPSPKSHSREIEAGSEERELLPEGLHKPRCLGHPSEREALLPVPSLFSQAVTHLRDGLRPFPPATLSLLH